MNGADAADHPRIARPAGPRVTQVQCELMVAFMEEHSSLVNAATNLGPGETFEPRRSLWRSLAALLNGAGRPQRDVRGWKKYWCERKKHAKDRARHVELDAQRTGGGKTIVRPLTDLEARIASLLGLNAIRGSAAHALPLPDAEDAGPPVAPSGAARASPSGINLPGPSGINLPGPSGINQPGPSGINLPGPSGVNLPGPSGVNMPGPLDSGASEPSDVDLPPPPSRNGGTPRPARRRSFPPRIARAGLSSGDEAVAAVVASQQLLAETARARLELQREQGQQQLQILQRQAEQQAQSSAELLRCLRQVEAVMLHLLSRLQQ
ncbi:hypothetical protein ISCGN_004857 [Ixodes scapularis]